MLDYAILSGSLRITQTLGWFGLLKFCHQDFIWIFWKGTTRYQSLFSPLVMQIEWTQFPLEPRGNLWEHGMHFSHSEHWVLLRHDWSRANQNTVFSWGMTSQERSHVLNWANWGMIKTHTRTSWWTVCLLRYCTEPQQCDKNMHVLPTILRAKRSCKQGKQGPGPSPGWAEAETPSWHSFALRLFYA